MAEAAKTKETITLEEARRVIDAAVRKAEEIGQPMDIAVVDAGGNLKAHVRMDGAFVGSITISINKAYTAIAFQQQTAHLQEDTRPGGPIFGLSDAHGGRLVVFQGHPPGARRRNSGCHRGEHWHRGAGSGGRRSGVFLIGGPTSRPDFEKRVVPHAGNCVKGEFELVRGGEDSLVIGAMLHKPTRLLP